MTDNMKISINNSIKAFEEQGYSLFLKLNNSGFYCDTDTAHIELTFDEKIESLMVDLYPGYVCTPSVRNIVALFCLVNECRLGALHIDLDSNIIYLHFEATFKDCPLSANYFKDVILNMGMKEMLEINSYLEPICAGNLPSSSTSIADIIIYPSIGTSLLSKFPAKSDYDAQIVDEYLRSSNAHYASRLHSNLSNIDHWESIIHTEDQQFKVHYLLDHDIRLFRISLFPSRRMTAESQYLSLIANNLNQVISTMKLGNLVYDKIHGFCLYFDEYMSGCLSESTIKSMEKLAICMFVHMEESLMNLSHGLLIPCDSIRIQDDIHSTNRRCDDLSISVESLLDRAGTDRISDNNGTNDSERNIIKMIQELQNLSGFIENPIIPDICDDEPELLS